MRIPPERLDELIEKMIYKAENIKAKMEPEVFEDVAYCLQQLQAIRQGKEEKQKFLVGDFVVYGRTSIGIVLKTWYNDKKGYTYEVYIRSTNQIMELPEHLLDRYRVRHKELNEEEMEYQEA